MLCSCAFNIKTRNLILVSIYLYFQIQNKHNKVLKEEWLEEKYYYFPRPICSIFYANPHIKYIITTHIDNNEIMKNNKRGPKCHEVMIELHFPNGLFIF